MVAQGEHIALVALQVHLPEVLALSKCPLTIAHAVTLEVSLGYQVETCRVTQFVPTGVVGIVGGTYGIDIELFHDTNILTHALHADNIASIRVQLMTVDSLDEDGLTIDKQLSVLDLHMTETDVLADRLYHTTVLLDIDEQSVEIRGLGSPSLNLRNGLLKTSAHHVAFGILKTRLYLKTLGSLDVDGE